MQQQCRIQGKLSIWTMDMHSLEKGSGQEEDAVFLFIDLNV